jgi:flagellar biosynthetic protein FlhB
MAETGQEKTEAPTPRRLQEARNDGNVARSTDLTAALILLGAILLLYFLGMRVITGMRMSLETFMSGSHARNLTRPDDIGGLASWALRDLFGSLSPLLLATFGLALVASVSQVGFLITGKPLVPSFSKLDPIKGTANLFSKRALMRLVMSLGKVLLIGAVSGWIIYDDTAPLLALAELQVGQAFLAASRLVFFMSLKLAVLLLILAIIDFAYQRWQHAEDLKMTKQQVKEEMRSMEGDPMVKQRRARVARQLAMQRMSAAVPGADVIVTNPTHYAVALKYDSATMRAPKVVAKGADFMAMRIRQLAALHGVPIVERKPLARALFAAADVGQEVPAEHYAAVAEILAYVYRLGERKSA